MAENRVKVQGRGPGEDGKDNADHLGAVDRDDHEGNERLLARVRGNQPRVVTTTFLLLIIITTHVRLEPLDAVLVDETTLWTRLLPSRYLGSACLDTLHSLRPSRPSPDPLILTTRTTYTQTKTTRMRSLRRGCQRPRYLIKARRDLLPHLAYRPSQQPVCVLCLPAFQTRPTEPHHMLVRR